MAIKGKILGAGIGAAILGPFGAAAGAFVGSMFDEESEQAASSNENGKNLDYEQSTQDEIDQDLMNDPAQIGGYYDMDDGNYYVDYDRDD